MILSKPLALTSDSAGEWGVGFELEGVVVYRTGDYARPPSIRQSFASLARFDFEPFHQIEVEATFSAYSSREALLALTLTNGSDRPKKLRVFAFALAPGRALLERFHDGGGGRAPLRAPGAARRHIRSPRPPTTTESLQDLLLFDSEGLLLRRLSGRGSRHAARARPGSRERRFLLDRERASPPRRGGPRSRRFGSVSCGARGRARVRQGREMITSGRDVLAVANRRSRTRGGGALREGSQTRARREEGAHLPRGSRSRPAVDAPPEGRTRFNYYVFSREPTWSWGHDGQVFHESLSMLAYAHLDPGERHGFAADLRRGAGRRTATYRIASAPMWFAPSRRRREERRRLPSTPGSTGRCIASRRTAWKRRRSSKRRYRSGSAFTEFLLAEPRPRRATAFSSGEVTPSSSRCATRSCPSGISSERTTRRRRRSSRPWT